LGECSPCGAEEQAQGSEIPWPAEQQFHGPMGRGLVCNTSYSFIISLHGEALHELGVQSAGVSALPFVLPQPSVSPGSQQIPWIMELRRSGAVCQSPSWISPSYYSGNHRKRNLPLSVHRIAWLPWCLLRPSLHC
jgi:hypothetical protein